MICVVIFEHAYCITVPWKAGALTHIVSNVAFILTGGPERVAHGPLWRWPEVVHCVLLKGVRLLHGVDPAAHAINAVRGGEETPPVLGRVHREQSLEKEY